MTLLNEDGTPDTSNDLVIRNASGDPLQDNGVLMKERESYERVIEGLKLAADAASHLQRLESEHAEYWRKWTIKLDSIRKISLQLAGIEDPVSFKETVQIRSDPMSWKDARGRFREGMKQAAGGMRQLSTCFRADFQWTRMAMTLEEIVRKLSALTTATARTARYHGKLWVPEQFH